MTTTQCLIQVSSIFPTQKREINTVLADVIKHMTPDRAFEDSYPQVADSPVSRPHCWGFRSVE